MRRNPVVLVIGAILVLLAAIIGFTYPQWLGRFTATEQAAAPAEPPASAPATPASPAEPAAETTATPAPAVPALAKPTFDVVRVDETGAAVIAGRAEPAADVKVVASGKELGAAKASEQGEWVIMSGAPLEPGSYELKAIAFANGTEVTSDQSIALVVPPRDSKEKPLAVKSAPNEPSTVLAQQVPAAAAVEGTEVKVSLDSIDYNDKGDILFAGQGPAGAEVRLYSDNNAVGTAAISPEGKWTFTSQGVIEPGDHTLRVDAVDANGKVIARIELPFTRTAPETAAEAAAQPKDGRIVIQPGNNLWRISRVIYGDGDRYTVIYQANKDQIRNPNLIYPGQVLMTPGVVPPESIDPDSRDPLTPAQ